jgi:hypothetical protein
MWAVSTKLGKGSVVVFAPTFRHRNGTDDPGRWRVSNQCRSTTTRHLARTFAVRITVPRQRHCSTNFTTLVSSSFFIGRLVLEIFVLLWSGRSLVGVFVGAQVAPMHSDSRIDGRLEHGRISESEQPKIKDKERYLQSCERTRDDCDCLLPREDSTHKHKKY